MKFLVNILARAKTDTREIHAWLAERSLQGAQHWYDAFATAVVSLEESPERHPFAPELLEWPEQVREVHFKTRRGRRYRILFVIRAGEVLILRVRGPGQPFVPPDEIE